MLSETTIQELKQILKEEYGRDMNLKEVAEIGNTLVGYFDLLAKIHYQEEKPKNKKDNENN